MKQTLKNGAKSNESFARFCITENTPIISNVCNVPCQNDSELAVHGYVRNPEVKELWFLFEF